MEGTGKHNDISEVIHKDYCTPPQKNKRSKWKFTCCFLKKGKNSGKPGISKYPPNTFNMLPRSYYPDRMKIPDDRSEEDYTHLNAIKFKYTALKPNTCKQSKLTQGRKLPQFLSLFLYLLPGGKSIYSCNTTRLHIMVVR